MWNLVLACGERVTIILTTHYIEEARKCGSRGVISKGELIVSREDTLMKKLASAAHASSAAALAPSRCLASCHSS